MKKILAVVLCLCMVIAILAGCSSSDTPSSSTPSSSTPASSGSTPASSGGDEPAPSGDDMTPAEKAIAERKESGNYPKIIFSFFTWTGAPAGGERISKLLSEYCIDKIGVDAQLLIMDMTSYRQQLPLMFASGEQCDIYAGNAIGFNVAINSGYAYDMAKDDLFNTYGYDIPNELPEWIMAGCYRGDGLYALPSVKDFAVSTSICCIAAKYLDGIGYDYNSKWEDPVTEECIRVTKWEDLDDIFAQLHEKYPDIAIFTSTGSLNQGYVYDNIGNDWFGVLLDPVNSLKVSDMWSSQEFKDITTRTHRYNQLGYVYANALTERVGMGTAIDSGIGMTVVSQGKPGYRTQASSEAGGNDLIPFQIGPDIVKSTAPTNVCYCMNSMTEDPIAAMQFLNLAYTDAYISNLLCWGEEGVEYQVLENGTIDYMPGVDRNTCEYATDMQWEMPNELLSHPWHTNTPDVWDRMRVFNEQAGRSLALGFTWDNTDYANQYTALYNVQQEYESPLMLGFYDPEVYIPEFVEKLQAAGLDDYMATKTAALTEWATAHGLADKL